MIRKSLHVMLLLFVLIPALTGWAGDCCPPEEARCDASCGESPQDPGHAADHHNTDPGHQQAVCGCGCHALIVDLAAISLSAPCCLGTLDPSESGDPSNAHLSEIFRPPLA